jgi:segregation and condensation protein B
VQLEGYRPDDEPHSSWSEAEAQGDPGLPTGGGSPAGTQSASKSEVIEALLFVAPEPLSVGTLCEVTGFEPGATREILNRLVDSNRERGGGVVIREVAGGFGFYACEEAAPYIARLIKHKVNPRLTRAALEAMAIVAYMQPVSRTVISEIRGVHSDSVVKTLEDRGLVCRVGKGGPPGYPALYATTVRFLERFGLNDMEDLPSLEEFACDQETVEKIKKSLSWELAEGDVVTGGKGTESPEGSVQGGNMLPEGGGEADN